MLYIFLIWLILGVNTYLAKASGLSILNFNTIVKYNILRNFWAIFFALCLALIGGEKLDLNITMFLSAATLGSVTAIDLFMELMLSKTSTTALSNIIHRGGVVIASSLAGIFLFNNPVNPIQWVFFALFMMASYMLCGASKEIYKSFSLKSVLMLLTHALCGGLAAISLQVFAKTNDGNNNMFLVLAYTVTQVLLLLIFPFLRFKPEEKGAKIPLKFKYFALMMGIVLALNQLFTVFAARVLDPIVQFSLIAVGGIAVSMLVGLLFFKEKITAKSGIAVAVSALSVVMINYFN